MLHILAKLDNFSLKFDYPFSMGFKAGVIFWAIKIRELDLFSKSSKTVTVFEIKHLLNAVLKTKPNMYLLQSYAQQLTSEAELTQSGISRTLVLRLVFLLLKFSNGS